MVEAPEMEKMLLMSKLFQLGGPDFDVPLGRSDSITFNVTAPDNLPVPFEGTDEQLRLFQSRKFDATDLVALSGEHTFGRSHCPITIDTNPPIDPNFKKQLEATCPNDQSLNTINLDITRRTKFDNMYYINLLNHQGVFPSDQDLASHPTTKEIVNLFASNQNEFSNKFANAFVKVSQLSVLIGNQGEIRKSCFAPSNRQSNMAYVVEEVEEIAANI
ncbi:LOW QUALITY PROTEIN: peroxidase 2-like [Medicago truncatula]|uniref:LOW QUALITY PROTEIN: peroxidase 2-like n=1 Tax=Medicago truncatula TaxID=3880 RepID=UPI000D2F3225|nr:LOW QUALITY PROTEIN: peroxidase 2-like [Medicago truncatula]